MSLAIVHSRANIGVEAPPITVEAHLSSGLPGFSIVGLPETVVKESRDRVRSAIITSRFEFPQKRITVNLAPADLPKGGGRFDLAIALGILFASGQLGDNHSLLNQHEFLGELALSGAVRRIQGVLPALLACRHSPRTAIVPYANRDEAGLVNDDETRVATSLSEVSAYILGEASLPVAEAVKAPVGRETVPDIRDVRGQPQACRALMVAAAGGHNLLLRGPPGTGKTLLASRLPGILPPLAHEQALEVAALRSIVTGARSVSSDWFSVPFRSPHHTASAVAMVGGGSIVHPGEISLAHHGILFLDELPEFSPRVVDVLREPLESGYIEISRARYQVRLPARFQLIAAMNPCPCGYFGDRERECRCTPDRVRKYQLRVSGPLLDRIDLHVDMQRPDIDALRESAGGFTKGSESESSERIRKRVSECMLLQKSRQGELNARLTEAGLRRFCQTDKEGGELLDTASRRMQLSVRARQRILRSARTLADLAGAEQITGSHILEAVAYRQTVYTS